MRRPPGCSRPGNTASNHQQHQGRFTTGLLAVHKPQANRGSSRFARSAASMKSRATAGAGLAHARRAISPRGEDASASRRRARPPRRWHGRRPSPPAPARRPPRSVASKCAGSGLRTGKLSPPPTARISGNMPKRLQQRAGGRFGLVGADRHRPSVPRQRRAEPPDIPGNGRLVDRDMGAVIAVEVAHRLAVRLAAAGGEGARHQHRNPSPTIAAISGWVNGGRAARRHQPVQRGGDVRHRVDQRPIEIQQQGSRHRVALRNLN